MHQEQGIGETVRDTAPFSEGFPHYPGPRGRAQKKDAFWRGRKVIGIRGPVLGIGVEYLGRNLGYLILEGHIAATVQFQSLEKIQHGDRQLLWILVRPLQPQRSQNSPDTAPFSS